MQDQTMVLVPGADLVRAGAAYSNSPLMFAGGVEAQESPPVMVPVDGGPQLSPGLFPPGSMSAVALQAVTSSPLQALGGSPAGSGGPGSLSDRVEQLLSPAKLVPLEDAADQEALARPAAGAATDAFEVQVEPAQIAAAADDAGAAVDASGEIASPQAGEGARTTGGCAGHAATGGGSPSLRGQSTSPPRIEVAAGALDVESSGTPVSAAVAASLADAGNLEAMQQQQQQSAASQAVPPPSAEQQGTPVAGLVSPGDKRGPSAYVAPADDSSMAGQAGSVGGEESYETLPLPEQELSAEQLSSPPATASPGRWYAFREGKRERERKRDSLDASLADRAEMGAQGQTNSA